MIALIQRVSEAQVRVQEQLVSAISAGVLALIGVQQEDGPSQVERLLERVLSYRIFADEEGRMNRSLRDTGGGLMLVSQFTLAADTRKGTRAGFSTAAPPQEAERLYALLVERARAAHHPVATGVFGANMQISLVNDGPVTFWLES